MRLAYMYATPDVTHSNVTAIRGEIAATMALIRATGYSGVELLVRDQAGHVRREHMGLDPECREVGRELERPLDPSASRRWEVQRDEQDLHGFRGARRPLRTAQVAPYLRGIAGAPVASLTGARAPPAVVSPSSLGDIFDLSSPQLTSPVLDDPGVGRTQIPGGPGGLPSNQPRGALSTVGVAEL